MMLDRADVERLIEQKLNEFVSELRLEEDSDNGHFTIDLMHKSKLLSRVRLRKEDSCCGGCARVI